MNISPEYRSQNLRKGRYSVPGAYYHIVIVTHQRQPRLANDHAAPIIFKTFDWLETRKRLEWICIIVMRDHLHTVIKLEKGQTLAKVLHSLKRFTAREINKNFSQSGPFWQKGYTDWNIRTDTRLHDTIRYCYMNPVRQGLIESAREYPYWRCKYEMDW